MQDVVYSVVILDDHPMVARGLAHFFESIRSDLQAHTVASVDELNRLTEASGCPHLVVADVWLPSGNVLEGMSLYCQRFPGARWLAISGDDDPSIAQRMRIGGAQGFVHKRAPPDSFAQAFAAILNGGQWFDPDLASASVPQPHTREWVVTPDELGITARQGEILSLVLRGLPNKRIALNLGISESTVKEHVTGILERLGVRTRVEAITLLRGRRVSLPSKV
jgi:DNA-binding NarL/FixJ family response regulator